MGTMGTERIIQTDAHRAMGSAGLTVELDARGRVIRWKLRHGGVWSTADLAAVQRMYGRDAR